MKKMNCKSKFLKSILSLIALFVLSISLCFAQTELLVDFGASEGENIYEVEGWNTVVRAVDYAAKYFDPGAGKPKGITSTLLGLSEWGGSYSKTYHGITGTEREFREGEKIIATWYNNTNKTIKFYPRISFSDVDNSYHGNEWDCMSWAEIAPYSVGKTVYEIDDFSKGNQSMVNIAPSFANTYDLIMDKIELADENWHIPNDGTFLGARETRTITANVYTGTDEDNLFIPNGSILPGTDIGNLVQVNYGSNATFTITPNTGLNYYDVIVDGENVNDYVVNNTYTFNDVTRDHVISVGFFEEKPEGTDAATLDITHNISGTLGPSGTITVKKGSNIFLKHIPHRKFRYGIDKAFLDGALFSVPYRDVARRELRLLNVMQNHTVHVNYYSEEFRYAIDQEDLNLYKSGDDIPENALNPSRIEYLGAFRVPGGSAPGDSRLSWSFSLGGITYSPDGDTGSSDNHPGSLFGAGHAQIGPIAEISIPNPVISKDLNELPTAEFIQHFTDASDWYHDYEGYDHDRIHELQYVPGQQKIYWSQGIESYGNYDIAHHGCTDPILGQFVGTEWQPNVQSSGVWHIGDKPATGVVMFTIPQSWATENLQDPDRILVTSGESTTGVARRGIGLFAIAPWKYGNPPADGATLDYESILLYGTAQGHEMENRNAAVCNGGGAWIEHDSESALALYQSMGYGANWYNGHGYGGAGSSDNVKYVLRLYNTDDLADAVQGIKELYEPQPYTNVDITPFMIRSSDYYGDAHNIRGLSGCNGTKRLGMAYDETGKYLYITEFYADGVKPVIHVFKIGNSTTQTNFTVDSLPLIDIKIYPNPATDIATLNIKLKQKIPVRIKVTNINGTVIKEENINSFSGQISHEIDLSDFSSGVYYVIIESDNFSECRKIIKL